MELFKRIEVVENISTETFDALYFQKQIPVVIKGLTQNTTAGSTWSINYFRETMGDHEIGVYDNSKKNSASANTHPDLVMKFKDFLNCIAKDEPTNYRIFLYNLFKHNPELRKEFPCPDFFKSVLDKVGRMFFGGKNTTVRIHYDIDMSNVLHTHFGARKRVVLIAPEYNDLLYRLPLNTYTLIDPDKPDYKEYPGLQYVKGYDFILEPGDTLFMPSGYWHYMTYLEGGFSVSYRRMGSGIPLKLSGFMNLCIYMPLDKLLNKVIGKKWLAIKQDIAKRKANQAIERKQIKNIVPRAA